MSLEDYQTAMSISGKEELQIVLPARDIFSDEIRVLITNGKISLLKPSVDTPKRRYSDIRLFSGSDNFEVGRQVLEGEFVTMTSLCNSFYILCTTRGSLNVHSSRTT